MTVVASTGTTTTTHATWADGGGNNCKNGSRIRASTAFAEPVHQTFVGTTGHGRRGRVRAHVAVRPWSGHSDPAGRAVRERGGPAATPSTLFPTIGIRSVLRTGVYTTLRLDDPQANQTLRCDPNFAQGQEFSAFRYGCKPWYGENHFNGDVPRRRTTRPRGGTRRRRRARPTGSGSPTATRAPASASTRATTRGAASSPRPASRPARSATTSPWRPTTATTSTTTRARHSFDCNYDGNYDGKPGCRPAGGERRHSGESRRTREARLGVPARCQPVHRPVPGEQGPDGCRRRDPGARLRLLLRHGLGRRQHNQSDPCPDTTYDHDGEPGTPQITMPRAPTGAITGVFVETVEYEPGPSTRPRSASRAS